MEIDIREESGGKPDVIRFASDYTITKMDRNSCVITYREEDEEVEVFNSDIPNLIKALKKYQELYGE